MKKTINGVLSIGRHLKVVPMILSLSTMGAATQVFAVDSPVSLAGHIPHSVQNMSDEGLVGDAQVMSVTVALQLNHETELDRRIASIYRPGSKNFHHFLTSAQFKSRYSPTDKQVARETAYLEAQGLKVQSISENRVLLHVQGTVSAINKAFVTELHRYRNRHGQAYFAPVSEPQIPAGSQISSVIGLSNTAHFHNHLKQLASHATSPRLFQGGMAPADLLSAYQISNQLDGKGQTLALFELDGYTASDIAGYAKQFKLPSANLQNVLVDGVDGTAGDGAIEVTLDIQMMMAFAPRADKIIVYEGPNSSQGLVDTYAKIANDNLAPQISTSWGASEDQSAQADMNAENTIFKQMVAQGQSLFSAAGDSGADDDGSKISVDDPASNPNVIGVGGTSLTLASGGGYGSETTWNGLSSGDGAGGGGVSTVWCIPSFQQNVNSSNSQVSTSMRNVPDVSLNADPATGYAVYFQGAWTQVGGTSAAAPLWAAFTALVNQQRQQSGLSGAGFVLPALYAAGVNSLSTSFNDIDDGSDNGNFKAVSGYDNATGWGTIKGGGLLQDLAQDQGADAPAPVAVNPVPDPGGWFWWWF